MSVPRLFIAPSIDSFIAGSGSPSPKIVAAVSCKPVTIAPTISPARASQSVERIASTSPMISWVPPTIIWGIPWTSASLSIGIRSFNRVGSCPRIFPTMGKRFPMRKVLTDSPSALSEGPISLPSARFPIRFLAADCIAEKEPEKVWAASFAVVPVIPRFSCMACIALYTSPRLFISYFTPVNFSASESSLSISDLVPP